MLKVEAESIVKEFEIAKSSLNEFLASLEIKIIEKQNNRILFDIKNSHPSLSNALRRILISKVPSVAIEFVSIYENNSIFPDEFIAHRLGLIPIKNVLEEYYNKENESISNCLNFTLNKKNNTEKVITVKSDDLEFLPLPGQEIYLNKRYDDTSEDEMQNYLVKKGVIICQLAPDQEIIMNMKAIKGRGEEHTKWSPVSLCTYRLMPRIIFEKDFYGEDAEELQKCFSPGVISIIDNKAVVENPRLDSMSREVLRNPKFADSVKIYREPGWFCFEVESLMEDPLELVKKGFMVLKEQIAVLKVEVHKLKMEYEGDE